MDKALRLLLILLPAMNGPTVIAQDPASRPSQKETSFDYRVEPLVDLYHYIREQATRRTEPDAPKEFDAAVAAAKKLCEKLGATTLEWEPLDQRLHECRTAAQLKRAFEQLPESIRRFRGPPVEARAEAIAFAEALIAIEPAFMKEMWPSHQKAIREARERIETQFRPKEAECIRYMLRSLGIDDPHDLVPVYLVHRSTRPGAYTIKRPGGGGLVFVQVEGKEQGGTLLYETILHEATHALDLSTGMGAGVFSQLREKLAAAGLTRRDPGFRDIPHTIMFIQAGETIRRIVDSKHKHYGVVAGYYERSGRVAQVERRLWIDHLNGKRSRDEAVDSIVRELTAKGDKTPSPAPRRP